MSDETPETEKPEKLKDLPTKPKDAAADAREQAQVYDSIFEPATLTFDDGSVLEIPPHPNLRMLDPDEQAAYDLLVFESKSYDREPDIVVPPQKVYDKNTKQLITTIPESTRPGPLIVPHQKTDENGVAQLITPSWEERTVRAALGEAKYTQLRAGTINGRHGTPRDVWNHWNRQNLAVSKRADEDDKSAGGAVDVAPVPEADS